MGLISSRISNSGGKVYTFALSFTNVVVAGVNVADVAVVVIGIAFIVVDDVAAVAAVVDVVIVGIV